MHCNYHNVLFFACSADGVYWSADPIDGNVEEIIQTLRYMQPRDDFINLGHAVTATSYALMLHLQHNELSASVPIMKWLSVQRMGPMGFSSTQVK